MRRLRSPTRLANTDPTAMATASATAGWRLLSSVKRIAGRLQRRQADMACTVDSSALLVYRAAWERDQGRTITREAAMAKLMATEGAQRVIDAAVQLHGGRGVRRGEIVESLYREIRALRIYEGASEVQQLIIGRDLLKNG